MKAQAKARRVRFQGASHLYVTARPMRPTAIGTGRPTGVAKLGHRDALGDSL